MFLRSVLAGAILFCSFAAQAQKEQSDRDKHIDIQTSGADLHMGTDANARKAGLPLYPGATPHHDEDSGNGVNLGLLTDAFGMKLVVAKYDSADAPAKVIDFYRDKLKKYGKVLECHAPSDKKGSHADINDDDDEKPKPLKCEGDNTGPVTELKVGTQNNQHVVAIEPVAGSSSSTFAIVYVHTRGKSGDI